MIKTIFYIIILVLRALASLTGCGQGKNLSGTERAAVLSFSEATTDNLFAGLAANDYATFSRDFDSDLYVRLPTTDFAAWKQDLDNQLGNYLSRQMDQVTQSDEFYVVVYQAKFEQEAQVTVSVAFHASDHTFALLSFESEQYSWSAWD